MNQKDILCMGLIFVIIYLLMKPNVEGYRKIMIGEKYLEDTIPVKHRSRRSLF